MNEYLKSFIIGSSAPVVFPFYYGVTRIPEKKFQYIPYSFIAPTYFGIMNCFRKYMVEEFGVDEDESYKIMMIASPLIVSARITLNKTYDFKSQWRWIGQYLLLFLSHGITFGGTIKFLEDRV